MLAAPLRFPGARRVTGLGVLGLAALFSLVASCGKQGQSPSADVVPPPAEGGSAFDATFGAMDSGPVIGSHVSCKVAADAGNGASQCKKNAPPNAFSPQVKWTYDALPPEPGARLSGSVGVPLVGNFTDDNGDGAIDLCDIPDVIVQTVRTLGPREAGSQEDYSTSNVVMLAGDTGKLEATFDVLVDSFVYPAFGDIDGDGLPDVIAATPDGHLVAFDHKGHVKWTGDLGGYALAYASAQCTTIAIYDLDGDGKPEILFGWEVFDNKGKKLWGDPTNAAEWSQAYLCVTPTAADLDGDGKLEVLMGHETFHADGSLYWKLPGFKPAHPHVANFDDDPEPEVFLANADGLAIVEHDGKIKFGPVRTTNDAPTPNCWGKPAVVHDFDGDGKADIAFGTCSSYSVYEVGKTALTAKWTNDLVLDRSGLATATAFDFLGSGSAEAIYADEGTVWAMDGKTGKAAFRELRSSVTIIEYPVVADVDNDGSAEIIYVSNFSGVGVPPRNTVTVLRDAQARWIPARRIWNQYSYHVTNVREDGTIPRRPLNSWQSLNTFRTNSQISQDGDDCDPHTPIK